MATKPSTRLSWATDATFLSGTAAGRNTKIETSVPQGFVPGTGIIAKLVNGLFHHILDDWIAWVEDGSSAGAADAHVVETDASGNTEVQGLTVNAGLSVVGLASMGGRFALDAVISPVAAATENDWSPTGIDTAAVVRLTPNAAGTSLTGIVPDVAAGGWSTSYRVLVLINVGGQSVTLEDENGGSTDYARFGIPAPLTIAPKESATLIYDVTSERWRVIG